MATKGNKSIEKWLPHNGHGGDDHEDDEWSCTDSEDYSCSEGDSDDDPSYVPSRDDGARFSALSINKTSMTATGTKPAAIGTNGRVEDVAEKKTPGVRERDIVDTVRVLVEAGQLEKLKVEECKDYLRRNGLRLTGNKETLIQRIREHYEMMAGEGERKYPTHSFVINCKGDTCIGDVVMFEQNVYEHYSIVSRSATAPPCGKRVIVGRIVKESYGARKQQHTFTIEVLWSKGEKPLPALHPLLIKGRNLYRFRTLRQRWEDEEQRQRILMEKHSRGDVARSDRETRIQEKERRNTNRANRMPKASQAKIGSAAERKTNNNCLVGVVLAKRIPIGVVRNHTLRLWGGKGLRDVLELGTEKVLLKFSEEAAAATEKILERSDWHILGYPFLLRRWSVGLSLDEMEPRSLPLWVRLKNIPLEFLHVDGIEYIASALGKPIRMDSMFVEGHCSVRVQIEFIATEVLRRRLNVISPVGREVEIEIDYEYFPPQCAHCGVFGHTTDGCSVGISQVQMVGRALASMNGFLPDNLQGANNDVRKRQVCRYFEQGRCYFGDNCKFLHLYRKRASAVSPLIAQSNAEMH